MGKNIKLGNNTLSNVSVLKVQDADNNSVYDSFVDTSSGDALASEIRTGKKAWVNGNLVTGNGVMATITINQDNSIDLTIA